MTKLFLLLIIQTKYKEDPIIIRNVLLVVSFISACLFIVMFFNWLFKLVEGFYADFIVKKPLFRHFYVFNKDLNALQTSILKKDFKFYRRLDLKQQKYFRYRVFKFMSRVEFIGKEGLVIDDEKKILVSATAIMLTFGYRNYNINLLDRILIYPSTFYSNIDRNYHKGHFNPGYRALILSWDDFLFGYKFEDDNLNLGIHEFVHALHLSYLKSKDNNDISAYIFINSLYELHEFINSDSNYKQNMKNSNYFRSYAFENDFEFIAVIIETFIETPQEFKVQFPKIYSKVKQMLNFNFAGY